MQAEDSGARKILVDLDQLSYIDSTGLRLLARAARRADSDGDRLRMTRAAGQVAEIFRLTTLDQILPFV